MFAELMLLLVAIIVALSIHEFAHALAAEYLGDPTARLMGRLTLNPIAHLDPIGSTLFVITLLGSAYSSGLNFIFGWGKPVPVDLYNLRNPRRDGAIIAFAGPLSNLVTALLMSILIRIIFMLDAVSIAQTFLPFFLQLMGVSVSLAIFNLIPVIPLDGSKIILGLVPQEQARTLAAFLEQYSTILLAIMIFTNAISIITSPISNLIYNILKIIAGF